MINFFIDDKDEAESEAVVQALEHIDDDCDRLVYIEIPTMNFCVG